jgi:hypothetical protein
MSRATVHNAVFSACQIPAFIGETEGSAAPVKYVQVGQFSTSSYMLVRSELSAWVEKTASVNRRFKWNIWSVRLIVCALRSVAGRRLVERENPSACATVNCKVCKTEIALYCLCECNYDWVCNQLIINPIIRTKPVLLVVNTSQYHINTKIYRVFHDFRA